MTGDVLGDSDMLARVRAATALRRLGHGIVGHDVPGSVLTSIAETVESWFPAVESAPGRSRSLELMKQLKRDMFERPGEGVPIGTFPDCVVSGDANPMGLDVQFFREGDEAVSRVVLGPAFEGAPNRAHGGVVAAVFDDLMGFVLTIVESPAYTAELTVRYRRPTPVNEEIEFRARLVSRRGRRLNIEAEATNADRQKIAEATALFVTIPKEKFGTREA
jgi:acyl-coenzyme A thioesterase PaaI-like protein